VTGLCGLLLAIAPALPASPPARQPAAVLLVEAAEPGQPERLAFRKGLEDALQAPSPVAIHAYSLAPWPAGNFDSPRTLDARVRERYQGVRMALLVALSEPAIAAALRWRDALWPGAPVVCVPGGDAEATPARDAPQTTVLRAHIDRGATLRAALSLFPETRTVAIVGGAEALGRPLSTLAAAVRAIDPRLERIDLVGLTMPELRRRVAALPPQTIVLSAGITLDGRGRRWLSADAHDYFAPSANAPIFTVHGGLLGHGVVGGVVLDYEALGREAAGRALRLLAGEPAAAMPAANTRSLRPQFDHRELERWGVDKRSLPDGSEIVFGPPSFWDEHKGKVVAAGIALLLQSLAITSLLLERRRRLSAERQLRQLSARLITAQEEERSRIARDLHDDASQRLALLAIELDQLPARPLADSARALSADLHRIAHQLHPAILDQLGLLPAARRFAAELAARHDIAIEVTSEGWPEALPRDAALVLYRVLQEALQNAARHSGAERIEVAFRGGGEALTLRVADPGRGFAPDLLEGPHGLGLVGMRERLLLVGGGLSIESAPGSGTILEAWLPLPVGARGMPRVADPVPGV